ncbi:hypothetical protein BFJ68_g6294 [Fusarium oxysporum]|uniref:Rhodopsin domain-containing protein n=1 Tax=Fusarium oxysporum TaxID=5507 RepID=A0A420RBD9_FUSOX|nr:hypothetical protein BFJ68_g6294 [Fusarium oxysporum]
MAEGLGQVISWYICTVIACIFLILRIWVRVRKLGLLAIDDGLIILAACCLIGDLIIQQHMWNLGMADMANASRDEFIQIMKMIVPGSILYVTSLWAIKIALVLFYKRLAAPGTKLQVIYNVTLGLLVIFWATIFFHIIFQCFPHDKRWSQDPNYQCDPKEAEKNYWLTVILNIGTDVIIIRAYYSKKNETMLTCTVSMIETAVAIIATCLPPLRTLFLGQMSSARSGSNYGRYELSSTGQPRSRRTNQSRIVTNVMGGTQKLDNDSQDELFKESAHSVAGRSTTSDKTPGITVNTTIQMHHSSEEEARRSQARLDSFA